MAGILYISQLFVIGGTGTVSARYYKKHVQQHKYVKKYKAVKQNQRIGSKRIANEMVAKPVSTSSEALADQILKTGHSYLGAPYVFGTSNGRTFDCSGFIKYIFGKHGIKLPSGSYNQVNLGTVVNRAELRKGDLIFFKIGNSNKVGHVGVYAGDNKILHTYQPGVRYDSLDAPWLKQGYVVAKRVI